MGKAFYTDKLTYEGEFDNNEYNGIGKLYFENGVLKFEGQFANGTYLRGKLYYNNGVLKYKG